MLSSYMIAVMKFSFWLWHFKIFKIRFSWQSLTQLVFDFLSECICCVAMVIHRDKLIVPLTKLKLNFIFTRKYSASYSSNRCCICCNILSRCSTVFSCFSISPSHSTKVWGLCFYMSNKFYTHTHSHTHRDTHTHSHSFYLKFKDDKTWQ